MSEEERRRDYRSVHYRNAQREEERERQRLIQQALEPMQQEKPPAPGLEQKPVPTHRREEPFDG